MVEAQRKDSCQERGKLCKNGWDFYRRGIFLARTLDRDVIIDRLISLALEYPNPQGRALRGVLRIIGKFFPEL